MKIAVMQPYFFPYLGYFQLINAADRFVLFDDIQYIRHGWINRNRIIDTNNCVQYIIVPVAKHSSRELIRNIRVSNDGKWQKDIRSRINNYKKKAPYFGPVKDVLESCILSGEASITRLNRNCLLAVFKYLGIELSIDVASELNLDYSGISNKNDLAISVSLQLNGTTYLNPPGGKKLYDKNAFSRRNLQLSFLKPRLTPYCQHREPFESALSIIDVMMFNEPLAVRQMLNDYDLI